MIERTCKQCNKCFNIKQSQIKRNRGIYCSKICSNIGKTKKIETTCNVCKKIFKCKLNEYIKGRHKRCSIKCSSIARTIRIKIKKGVARGENHWNWKGGITSESELIRSSNKYKKFRKKIYERDNYTCQICGVRGTYLQVDHIKPFALFPELIYSENNCRTLCLKCHHNTETFGTKLMFKINKYGKEQIKKEYTNI